MSKATVVELNWDKSAEDELVDVVMEMLWHVGQETLRIAQNNIPLETGTLRRSGTVTIGDLPDAEACASFDKTTRNGKDMSATQDLLATAVASIVGKKEERAVASLFSPGGTHAMKGEFAGSNDFEVLAYLVVVPGHAQGAEA